MVYIPAPRRDDSFVQGARLGIQISIAAANRDLQRRKLQQQAEDQERRAVALAQHRQAILEQNEKRIQVTRDKLTSLDTKWKSKFIEGRGAIEKITGTEMRIPDPWQPPIRPYTGPEPRTLDQETIRNLGHKQKFAYDPEQGPRPGELPFGEAPGILEKDPTPLFGGVEGGLTTENLRAYEQSRFGKADQQKRLQQAEIARKNEYNKVVRRSKDKKYLQQGNSADMYEYARVQYQKALDAAGNSNPKRRKAFNKYKTLVSNIDNAFPGNRVASGLRWSDVQYRPPARGRGGVGTGLGKLKTFHRKDAGDDIAFQTRSKHPIKSSLWIDDVLRDNPQMKRRDLEENIKSIGVGKGKGVLSQEKRVAYDLAIETEKARLEQNLKLFPEETRAEIKEKGYIILDGKVFTRKEVRAISPNIELSESFEDALGRRPRTRLATPREKAIRKKYDIPE